MQTSGAAHSEERIRECNTGLPTWEVAFATAAPAMCAAADAAVAAPAATALARPTAGVPLAAAATRFHAAVALPSRVDEAAAPLAAAALPAAAALLPTCPAELRAATRLLTKVPAAYVSSSSSDASASVVSPPPPSAARCARFTMRSLSLPLPDTRGAVAGAPRRVMMGLVGAPAPLLLAGADTAPELTEAPLPLVALLAARGLSTALSSADAPLARVLRCGHDRQWGS